MQMIDKCKCVSSNYVFTDEQFRQTNFTVCGNQTSSTGSWEQLDNIDCFRQLQCSYAQDTLDIETLDCLDQCEQPCTEVQYDLSVSYGTTWPAPSYIPAFYNKYILGQPVCRHVQRLRRCHLSETGGKNYSG
jgi:hypothetical protein